jgi:hypothetical protein
MYKLIIILSILIISCILLIIGHNAITKTEKTIDFFKKYSGSTPKTLNFLKIPLGDDEEIFWMKIVGYGYSILYCDGGRYF